VRLFVPQPSGRKESEMPDWLVALCIVIAWVQGLWLGGVIWASGPFWDGVHSVFRSDRSQRRKGRRSP